MPGTFELPAVLARAAAAGRFDAVVALGAVIRGGTRTSSTWPPRRPRGWRRALGAGCAVALGVLTCDTMEQALERAGVKGATRGSTRPCRPSSSEPAQGPRQAKG